MRTFAPDFFMISMMVEPLEPITIPTFSGSIFSSTVIAAAELIFQNLALKNTVLEGFISNISLK
jgi:hypothetical protein